MSQLAVFRHVPAPTALSEPIMTILFACAHNAGRSQIAAGVFNAVADPEKAHAISAGTHPAADVDPTVVEAMREIGIDVGSNRPQLLTLDVARKASMLVTMGCGDECPVVSGVARDDWPLDDPTGQPLAVVRKIRDEIRGRVHTFVTRQGLARGL